jgi:hypothetical protein
LLQAGVAGTAATLLFYLFLLFVQIQNAEDACEGFGPTGNYEDVRGIGFENSFLNLGGRCTYRMDDGSVVVTREPGWWFSGTIAGFVAAFAVVVAYLVRRRGHMGLLYGLTALFAPPLGFALALVAPRRTRSGAAS